MERGADLHMAQRMPLPLTVPLASAKSRLVFTFWYRLTWVVPNKGPLNGCVCVCFGTTWQKQWSDVHQLFSVLLLCGPLLIFHILSTSVQYRLFEHIKIASSENLTSMLIKNKS